MISWAQSVQIKRRQTWVKPIHGRLHPGLPNNDPPLSSPMIGQFLGMSSQPSWPTEETLSVGHVGRVVLHLLTPHRHARPQLPPPPKMVTGLVVSVCVSLCDPNKLLMMNLLGFARQLISSGIGTIQVLTSLRIEFTWYFLQIASRALNFQGMKFPRLLISWYLSSAWDLFLMLLLSYYIWLLNK